MAWESYNDPSPFSQFPILPARTVRDDLDRNPLDRDQRRKLNPKVRARPWANWASIWLGSQHHGLQLDLEGAHNHLRLMDWMPPEALPFGQRIDRAWKRGVRFVTRAAIAFALSAAAAIWLGAAVTDNGLAQSLITVLAALALWVPSFFTVVRIDKWFARRETHHGGAAPEAGPRADDHVWRRLFALAPAEAPRLAVLRRSLERSRQSLGSAELDPEAHELCILIDRRLPELIHHELEILPPDDLHRRREVGDLINLLEQFARHCSRRGSAEDGRSQFQAEVLRRRFEARLSEF